VSYFRIDPGDCLRYDFKVRLPPERRRPPVQVRTGAGRRDRESKIDSHLCLLKRGGNDKMEACAGVTGAVFQLIVFLSISFTLSDLPTYLPITVDDVFV
jgi:hypothetical protein